MTQALHLFKNTQGRTCKTRATPWQGRSCTTCRSDVARQRVLLDTLVSYIDPDNTRSIALAERLGAARDDDAKAAHEGDLVYRHLNRRMAR